MKARKLVLLFLILTILVTGVCGCMDNQNNDLQAENMKSYASNKYGREFTVENFQAAKDATYTNILSVSDGEYIFNVYQSGDSEPSDDYPQAVVNKKLTDYLNADCGAALEVYGNFIFSKNHTMSLAYAKESDISTILHDYSLLKTVIVIKTSGDIAAQAEALYRVYKNVLEFGPKYIDFEVIQVDSASTELNDMLVNLPAFYNSMWSKHSEIKGYLSVTDTDITSASELVMEVK